MSLFSPIMRVFYEDLFYINMADIKHLLTRPGSGDVHKVTIRNSCGTVTNISFTHWSYSGGEQELTLGYTFRGKHCWTNVRLYWRTNATGQRFPMFICPISGQVCFKLHLMAAGFRHRCAIRGACYRHQVLSRKQRSIHRLFTGLPKVARISDSFRSRYNRFWYRQRPTLSFISRVRRLSLYHTLQKIHHEDFPDLRVEELYLRLYNLKYNPQLMPC